MDRRRFLIAAPAFLAAPALVRASSIMPVRAVEAPVRCVPEFQSYAELWCRGEMIERVPIVGGAGAFSKMQPKEVYDIRFKI